MSTYAIGDVHGCYAQLCDLLDKIAFNETSDALWFAGDLVNRGDNSLDVLRFVKSLKSRAVCVLGNHDFHLMRFAAGMSEVSDAGMQAVLAASDRDELLDWLYHRPLFKRDEQRKLLMVHAGIFPQWDIETACLLAEQVSAQLTDPDLRDPFLENLYGDQPEYWQDSLQGADRLRIAVNVMTRMRYLDEASRLDFSCAHSPAQKPPHLTPWHELAHQRDPSYTVLFGHWAAQGFLRMPGYIGLDSGCVWGGSLTAVRLDDDQQGDQQVFQVACT